MQIIHAVESLKKISLSSAFKVVRLLYYMTGGNFWIVFMVTNRVNDVLRVRSFLSHVAFHRTHDEKQKKITILSQFHFSVGTIIREAESATIVTIIKMAMVAMILLNINVFWILVFACF